MTAVYSTCQCHSQENTTAKPEGLRGLDLLGVVLSSACLIHCTLLPAVLALLPLLGNQFHLALLYYSFDSSGSLYCLSYRLA